MILYEESHVKQDFLERAEKDFQEKKEKLKKNKEK